MKKINIEIVSDVSCPWCLIGYKSLAEALTTLASEITAHITWKPFELNPQMPAEGQLLSEHLQQKYGATLEELEQGKIMITARGAAHGFCFNYTDDKRIYNTFNAHRLLYWARKFGKQTELKLALFELYFSEGGNPGNVEQLMAAVAKVGLPTEEAGAVLASEQFMKEVSAEEAVYRSMGIESVPTFIINGQHKITGGMPVGAFADLLNKIAMEQLT